jgi:hypothetical protein
MARIYLAAGHDRKREMCRYRDQLAGYGHHVTSRWIDLHEYMGPDEILEDPAKASELAIDNIADILSADLVLVFTDTPSTYGHRHTEFGAALMSGKQILIIGQKENVFQVYKGVDQFDTWAKFIEHVGSIHASTTASRQAGSSESPYLN